MLLLIIIACNFFISLVCMESSIIPISKSFTKKIKKHSNVIHETFNDSTIAPNQSHAQLLAELIESPQELSLLNQWIPFVKKIDKVPTNHLKIYERKNLQNALKAVSIENIAQVACTAFRLEIKELLSSAIMAYAHASIKPEKLALFLATGSAHHNPHNLPPDLLKEVTTEINKNNAWYTQTSFLHDGIETKKFVTTNLKQTQKLTENSFQIISKNSTKNFNLEPYQSTLESVPVSSLSIEHDLPLLSDVLKKYKNPLMYSRLSFVAVESDNSANPDVKTLEFYKIGDPQLLYTFNYNKNSSYDFLWDNEGRYFLSINTSDLNCKIHDILLHRATTIPFTLSNNSEILRECLVHDDTNQLFFITHDVSSHNPSNALYVWNLSIDMLKKIDIQPATSKIYAIRFSPDKTKFFANIDNSYFQIWSIEKEGNLVKQCVIKPKEERESLFLATLNAQFSTDGSLLAVVDADTKNTLLFYDAITGQAHNSTIHSNEMISHVTPDFQKIVTNDITRVTSNDYFNHIKPKFIFKLYESNRFTFQQALLLTKIKSLSVNEQLELCPHHQLNDVFISLDDRTQHILLKKYINRSCKQWQCVPKTVYENLPKWPAIATSLGLATVVFSNWQN